MSDLGQINLGKFDHNNQMITLSVITLSGFHCTIFTKTCFWKLYSNMIHESIPNMSRAIMSSAMHCMSFSSCTIKGTLEKKNIYIFFRKIDSNIIHASFTNMKRSMHLENYSYIYSKRCFWRPNPMPLIHY
jgi:hypothetical protein